MDDGRVFFTSQDGLLPADTNGQNDVYLWNRGELRLISSGSSPEGARFYSASADGEDLFFLTADALVPQDSDDLVDLYDARVNGGFASQFATRPPSCGGEECRGVGTQPPNIRGALTPSFEGPGNPRCPKGKRLVKARNGKTRCVKKKHAKRHHRKQHHHRKKRASNDRRASR